jgi:hypothetical protein
MKLTRRTRSRFLLSPWRIHFLHRRRIRNERISRIRSMVLSSIDPTTIYGN